MFKELSSHIEGKYIITKNAGKRINESMESFRISAGLIFLKKKILSLVDEIVYEEGYFEILFLIFYQFSQLPYFFE